MRIPKKIVINDIKCHPFDTKVLIACSDGYVIKTFFSYIFLKKIRMWDQISFHSLVSISDPSINPTNKKSSILQQILPGITSLSFSSDGQKLLSSDESGRIFCWDARNLGYKNILLATDRVSELGILSICCKTIF